MTRRPDFAACYEAGRRYFSRNFVLFVRMPGQDRPEWKAGVAVTKKSGSAVERNRIKRVLREFFRIHQCLLPANIHIIAVPKRRVRACNVSLSLVTTELAPILEKIGRAARDADHGEAF